MSTSTTTEPRNRLAKLRAAYGLSQKELAARIPSARSGRASVHERTIDRWERGETSIPERHWHELATIFGVSVAHLLMLDEPNGDGLRAVV